MSALAYAIATASPSTLLVVGFAAGTVATQAVGLLVDAIRARRHG